MTLQELFDRGDPPQTGCSSRRKKQHQPGPFHGSVEGLLEHWEVRGSERGERFLSGGRGRIHAKVRHNKKQGDHGNANPSEFLLHLAAPER